MQEAKWPSVNTIIEVASERTEHNKTYCDSRWYLSSLSVDAGQAAKAIRSHWGIENQLHWILDVVFREDELSISDPVGAAHMALFNRVSLSLLKQHTRMKNKQSGIPP